MRKALLSILFVLIIVSIGHSTTLLEANWDVASTCSQAAVRSGVWTADSGDICNAFDIGTGGPGDRNYLRLKLPASDLTDYISSNPTMSNPATMYIRFWFRFNYNAGAMHPFYLDDGVLGPYGIALVRAWNNSFSIIPGTASDVYYYNGSFTNGIWYRLEYKLTGGGGSSGTMEIKLNGVDIGSNMISDSSGRTITQDSGGFGYPALNYIYFSTYYGQGAAGNWMDITGLKVTDDDWIGGDADTTAPTVSSITIGSSGTSWTLVYSESVTCASTANCCDDFTAAMTTAGAITLSYSSGSGTNSVVCTGNKTVYSGDTVANGGIDYTTVGDGIEDAAGNDLASFENKALTNNSTQVTAAQSVVGTTILGGSF